MIQLFAVLILSELTYGAWVFTIVGKIASYWFFAGCAATILTALIPATRWPDWPNG